MSDLSGVRRIKNHDRSERRRSRAVTVVMSSEELDILLSIDAAIGQRDSDRPTVVPPQLDEVG